MIHSTSSSDRTARTDAVPPVAPKPAVRGPQADHFSAGNSAALREALASQPEIRPEVVARGRELAADPAYPPPAVLREVAGAILRAPDLTDDAT